MTLGGWSGWRLCTLIVLSLLFPIIFHPWWLAVICVAVYGLLVWLISPKQQKSS